MRLMTAYKNPSLSSTESILVLLNAMIICGFIAVFLGKDLDFDLANYHFHNAYAFLYQRYKENFWPGSYLHVFLAPTPDLLTYFLINNFPPIAAVFISGSIHGINFWLLFLLAQFFLSRSIRDTLLALVIAGMSMLGSLTLPSVGNFKNDLLVSIFILSFVLIMVITLQGNDDEKKNYKLFILANTLLGMAIGLKLTEALFGIGAFLSFLFLPFSLRDKCKWLSIAALSMCFGMLLTSGYWIAILWQEHHNPLYPFFNSIFKSSGYPVTNFNYTEFTPQTIWQRLAFPIVSSFKGTRADGHFRDLRFFIIYALFMICGILYLYERRFKQKKSYTISVSLVWLYYFFIFSYLVGEVYFGTIRYMLALEILAPLMIVVLVKQIMRNLYAIPITLLIFAILILSSQQSTVGTRVKYYGEDYFNVRMPSSITQIPEALVLTPYTIFARSNDPRPQAYLIAFLPKNWRYIGIPFHQEKFVSPGAEVLSEIEQRIAMNKQPIFLLTVEESMRDLMQAARLFHLRRDHNPCSQIFSERQLVNQSNVLLCGVVKER